jgi:hypothetical protein
MEATMYLVKTQDVDGIEVRNYQTLSGARNRFLEMSGMTLEEALQEQYGEGGFVVPEVSECPCITTVSPYGCRVVFMQEVGA